MFIKKILFLLLFISSSFCTLAQQGSSLVSPYEGLSGRLRLLPPNAAKIEEFGNIPLNFSTGQLNFSLPLYEIQVDESLKIPIQLTYSNTGLKPQDVPTWVGNGWNLEVGGTIVQNINGVSDFSGLKNLGVRQQMESYLTGGITGIDKYNYMTEVLNNQVDTQYDLFSFNFLGRSGKFYFYGDDIILMNKMPLKITYASNSFTITDEMGYKFDFNSSVANGGTFSDGSVHPISDPLFISSVTWYLSKITSPNGVVVDFSYNNDTSYQTSLPGSSYSMGYSGGASCVWNNNFSPSQTNTETGISQKLLKEITWKGKKVEFKLTPRNDLMSISGIKANALDAILVYDEATPAKVVKRIGFGYGYIGTNDRLKLNTLSVAENNSPLNAVQTHSFEYYEKSGTEIPIPALMTPSGTHPANNGVDHWGYYNGMTDNPNKVPIADYSLITTTTLTNFGFADRRADNTYSKIGMLKKVIYPTKGFTEIHYEPNIVTYNNASEVPFFLKLQTPETPPASGGINLQIGGNRVSRIVDNSGNQESNERIITYEQANLLAVPYYVSSVESGLLSSAPIPTGPCTSCGTKYFVSDNNIHNWDGYQIEYRKVTETYGNAGAQGKKIYEFSGNFHSGPSPSEPPYAATVNLSWRSGNLLKDQTYERNTAPYSLLKETSNTYNPVAIIPITRYGFKAGRIMTCQQEAFAAGFDYNYFTHLITPVFSDFYHLKSSTTTEYFGGVALSNTISYDYTPEVLLKKTSTTNSKNKLEETTTYYANDFNNIAGTNIDQLKTKNIIGMPLKVVRTVDSKAVDGVMIKSDANGNPIEIYRYESASPATITHDPAQFILPEFKLFESRKYSSKGNPVEIKRLNLPPTTYVWGYKHSYPFASVQNASKASVEAVIGNLDTVADLYLDTQIEEKGTALRSGFPSGMVTYGVMKSGIGLSKMVAPNGLKNTYDYDDINRLISIKNHTGGVTNSYKYFYAPAP